MKIYDLEFAPMTNGLEGVRAEYYFPNDLGISVVSHEHSYGGGSGKYEIAILSSDGSLNYETEITDDVIGWLTLSDVMEIMERIENLKG